MCNCGHLKYANKNHAHLYVTPQQLNAAIDPLIDQSELDAALATLDYYTQAEVDALIAGLQSQIDDINQALIDCGCGPPEPCIGFAEEFAANADAGTVVSGDWIKSWASGSASLRLVRDTTEFTDNCVVQFLPGIPYRTGMTIDFEMNNQSNIGLTEVRISTLPNVLFGSYTFSGTGVFTDSRDVASVIPSITDGEEISKIEFNVIHNLPNPEFTRWLLDYVRLVCP